MSNIEGQNGPVCYDCCGGGRIAIGPWGSRPPTKACEACKGTGVAPLCKNCGNPIHPFGPDEYGNEWAHNDPEESFDCPDSSGVIVAEPEVTA